jgi:hypothetical protein
MKKQNSNRVEAAALLPDFDNLPGDLQATYEAFHLGLTHDCPLGQIDVAGLHFPGYNEVIETNNAGQQVRTPGTGTVNRVVTRQHFDALVEVLPRLVIRFTSPRTDEPGTGQNVGDPVSRRKGYLIKIPDERMIAGATAHGRQLKPYVKQEGDEPAAKFMFFLHAPDGLRHQRFVSIADNGLDWPSREEEEVIHVHAKHSPDDPALD